MSRKHREGVFVQVLCRDLGKELAVLRQVHACVTETATIAMGESDHPTLAGLTWELGANLFLSAVGLQMVRRRRRLLSAIDGHQGTISPMPARSKFRRFRTAAAAASIAARRRLAIRAVKWPT